MTRIRALVAKELADLRQHPGVFVPGLLTGFAAILLPFFVAVIVPWFTGERLADSSDVEIAEAMYRSQPASARLSPEGAIQAWIFQQFLLLLVLAPVAGSMSVAASSVVGEKQARTLEPLLATPITTVELLIAKILGAALPAAALTLLSFAVYLVLVVLFAESGVWRTLLWPQPLVVMFLLGPFATLAALQLAVCVSSRAHDARSAQQIGALVVLPIAGLLVAQLTGSLQLSVGLAMAIAFGLAVLNVLLLRMGIVLFDRESILTR